MRTGQVSRWPLMSRSAKPVPSGAWNSSAGARGRSGCRPASARAACIAAFLGDRFVKRRHPAAGLLQSGPQGLEGRAILLLQRGKPLQHLWRECRAGIFGGFLDRPSSGSAVSSAASCPPRSCGPAPAASPMLPGERAEVGPAQPAREAEDRHPRWCRRRPRRRAISPRPRPQRIVRARSRRNGVASRPAAAPRWRRSSASRGWAGPTSARSPGSIGGGRRRRTAGAGRTGRGRRDRRSA